MKKIFSTVSGFTLIEMMVVIAIIAILASIFLVGLGSFRRNAYDTRRISDLQHVQNYLELYYNSAHQYPKSADYNTLTTDLIAAGIGVTALPKDPQNSGDYIYRYTRCTGGQGYVLGATISGSASILNDMPDSLAKETCDGSFNSNCGKPPGSDTSLKLYCVGE